MKTYLDCIPCFFKQAIRTMQLIGVDEALKKKIIDRLSKLISAKPSTLTPPEIARDMHRIIKDMTGNKDPYREVKKRSNKTALEFYPILKRKIENSNDKLLTAVEFAIAGNVIDYGAKGHIDVEKEIEQMFSKDFSASPAHKEITSEYKKFKESIAEVKKILYLADNAGEIVFDRALIEELKIPTVFAVRGEPIINDVVFEDALACGIDRCAEIISNGSDAPGTILKFCSPEFMDIWGNADLIISKGQGNFETLTDEKKLIYFLFKVKCPVVAKHTKSLPGSMLLKKTLNYRDAIIVE